MTTHGDGWYVTEHSGLRGLTWVSSHIVATLQAIMSPRCDPAVLLHLPTNPATLRLACALTRAKCSRAGRVDDFQCGIGSPESLGWKLGGHPAVLRVAAQSLLKTWKHIITRWSLACATEAFLCSSSAVVLINSSSSGSSSSVINTWKPRATSFGTQHINSWYLETWTQKMI